MKKQFLLTLFPVLALVLLALLIYKLYGWEPDGTHANLAHIYDGVFVLAALVAVVMILIALLVLWISGRFRWYVYGVNLFCAVGSLVYFGTEAIDYFDDYRYTKEAEEKKEVLSLLQVMWEDVDGNEEAIKKFANAYKADEYLGEIEKTISAMLLSLSLQKRDDSKELRLKSEQFYPNRCDLAEEILSHQTIENEDSLIDLFTYVGKTEPTSYEAFEKGAFSEKFTSSGWTCIPRGKLRFDNLVEEKKYSLLHLLIRRQYFQYTHEVVTNIKALLNITEEQTRHALIEEQLFHYTDGDYGRFSWDIQSILHDAEVLALLKGQKAFTYYEQLLLIKHRNGLKEAYAKEKQNRQNFKLEHWMVKSYGKVLPILGESSLLLNQLPEYVKAGFAKALDYNAHPEKYLIVRGRLRTHDIPPKRTLTFRYRKSPYTIYIDGALHENGISSQEGDYYHLFPLALKGKKIIIQYEDYALERLIGEEEKLQHIQDEKVLALAYLKMLGYDIAKGDEAMVRLFQVSSGLCYQPNTVLGVLDNETIDDVSRDYRNFDHRVYKPDYWVVQPTATDSSE